MTDHYFTPSPQSEHHPATFDTQYRGQRLTFVTDSGVFSRTGMDKGTQTLLDALPPTVNGQVLDMGCGYGALGVSLKKAFPSCSLTMADINERAVALAAENAKQNGITAVTLQSDGFTALAGRTFDLIALNPPIRAGKKVIYRLFADGAAALNNSGAMIIVIRKQQGAPSAKVYLETLFRKVEIIDRSGGYWVLWCSVPTV
ncbi:MAG: methyltransferase [Candidatus Pacebacteria bacterium]|nr:methyltransferase [Candidatus Paceibacterota bacterium]